MLAIRHCIAVDLRFDVDNRSSIGLEPCNVDLNIKVSDTRGLGSRIQSLYNESTTNLQTMASSGMTEK